MSPLDLAPLSDAELRALEGRRTLPDAEWRAVIAELARRSTAPTPAVYDRRSVVSSQTAERIGAVRVVAIDLPFWHMVGFMVKWAIASVPAFFILALILVIPFALFGGVVTALTHLLPRP